MARTYIRLRETIFDLYVERDQIPSFFRPFALVAAWLVLIGYILFAIAFSTPDNDLSISRTVLTTLGSALFIIGYITAILLAVFGRSLLFLIDGILYPVFTSSLMGIILTILMHALHLNHPVGQIYVSIPLVTSCVTTIITLVLMAIVYKELARIRRRDERRRWHAGSTSYMGSADASSLRSHQRSISGPEDEAQRRQLMRLLHDRNEQVPVEHVQATYKIDIPGHDRAEARGRAIESAPPVSHRFNVTNLLPWHSSNDGTFKDARERRREEIERAGLPNNGPANRTMRSRSQSTSREPGRPEVSPPVANTNTNWQWVPATRYA